MNSMIPSLSWQGIVEAYTGQDLPAAGDVSTGLACSQCLRDGIPTEGAVTLMSGTAYCRGHLPLL